MRAACLPVFLLALCSQLHFTFGQLQEYNAPPLMVKQPPAGEILFQVVKRSDETKNPFKIECLANGSQPITYSWKKNGKEFSWAEYDDRISQQPNSGTLVVSDPQDVDIGSYQCHASNDFGTASSNTAFVRKAVLASFKSSHVVSTSVAEGQPLVLTCESPQGYPPPRVQWFIKLASGDLQSIKSSRLTVDPRGNLYFTNVTLNDASGDSMYVCAASTPDKNEYKLGNGVRLSVSRASSGSARNRAPPVKQYTSLYKNVGRRGDEFRLWCIFSGTPRPDITWKRDGGRRLFNSGRIRADNYGRTLVLSRLQLLDAGQYTCTASNGVGTAQTLTFGLDVEETPRFLVEPRVVIAARGEQAAFECRAVGEPKPQIQWIRNGRPLDVTAAGDARYVRSPHRLVIRQLTSGDTANIGCNATNRVGYVYREVFISVQQLAPEILAGPADRAVVVGRRVVLVCDVFGAPRPSVQWRRGGHDGHQLTGGRYTTALNGSLIIDNVMFTDAGQYTCHAKNYIKEVWDSGSLVVKERTRFTETPADYRVVAGDAATFRCSAVGDPTLSLSVGWRVEGVDIDFDLEPRFIQTSDNSLTITKTTELDSKQYSCVASTSLDGITADATLIVEDVPNAPALDSVDCRGLYAAISWRSRGENRAPILSYTIQHNTSFTPDTWLDSALLRSSDTTYTVLMSAWANYTFRVVARNKVGVSLPSVHSAVCTTRPRVPATNPRNVVGGGTSPHDLLISWTPMPLIEHNGPGLNYRVQWRVSPEEEDDSSAEREWQSRLVTDWRQSQLLVERQPTHQRYQLLIRAINQLGESTEAVLPVYGWSGEGIPSEAPANFRLLRSVDGQRAEVAWDPVSPDSIHGHFRGYKVQVWPQKEGRDRMREQLFSMNVSRGLVNIIQPFAMNSLQVVAFNGAYDGPPSNIVQVRAPEGSPSAVESLDAVAMGSSALFLYWSRPAHTNGILTSYRIYHQRVDGLRLGPLQLRRPSVARGETRAKLAGLEPATKYRVIVRAVNGAGEGAPYYIERRTQGADIRPPDPPSFVWTQQVSGDNNNNNNNEDDTSLAITWLPNLLGQPGSHFFVQYRRDGESSWVSSPAEYYTDTTTLAGLRPGQLYEVRVVSVDGLYYAPSQIQQVQMYATAGSLVEAASRSLLTSGWLAALLLTLALLLVGAALVCWLRQRRLLVGEHYDVQQRELLRGAGSVATTGRAGSGSVATTAAADDFDCYDAREVADERSFPEYRRRPPATNVLPSGGSQLTYEVDEEDDDGMMAGGDGINEDGSFIGQYTGSRLPHQPRRPAHAADKVGTFV